MSVDGVLLSAKQTKKNSLEKERRVEKTQCELKRERERERLLLVLKMICLKRYVLLERNKERKRV